jgi:hypothetical protein
MTIDTEVITVAQEQERELWLVRYQKGHWTFIFNSDPGLDMAINPQGETCTGMWSPTGYRHPDIPVELIEQLEGLMNSIS